MGAASSTVARNGVQMTRIQMAQRAYSSLQRRERDYVRQQLDDEINSDLEHQDEFKRIFGGSASVMGQQMNLSAEQQSAILGLALDVAKDQGVREAVSNSPAFQKLTLMLAQSHESQQNLAEIDIDNNNNSNFRHENSSNNSHRILVGGAVVGTSLLVQPGSEDDNKEEEEEGDETSHEQETIILEQSSNYIVEEQPDDDIVPAPVAASSSSAVPSNVTSVHLPTSEAIRNLDPTNPIDAQLLTRRQKFQNQLLQISQLFDRWLLNSRDVSASNVVDSMQKMVVIIAISYLSIIAVRRINPTVTVTFITSILKSQWDSILGLFHQPQENASTRRKFS